MIMIILILHTPSPAVGEPCQHIIFHINMISLLQVHQLQIQKDLLIVCSLDFVKHTNATPCQRGEIPCFV